MSYKITIVGATGNVGRKLIEILVERKFPIKELVAIASDRSLGKQISFGEKDILVVKSLDNYDFSDTDITIFAVGREVSRKYVVKARDQNSIVIDNSSYFRMDGTVPLIIPEVNKEDLRNLKKTRIVANPNCSLIQLLTVLKPLDDIAELKRIVLSTYQSTSGAGKAGMDELYNQTKSIYVNQKSEPAYFKKQIAFNIISQIGELNNEGITEEEQKIINEAKKIMGSNLQISTTCIRVPVFVGHSLSVNAEFHENLTAKKAKSVLSKISSIRVINDNNLLSPIDVVGEDAVYVSRIREDRSTDNALNMWIVCDNLRKGAALNAVQIAEEIIKNYL